jgi:hypothetical protein
VLVVARVFVVFGMTLVSAVSLMPVSAALLVGFAFGAAAVVAVETRLETLSSPMRTEDSRR